MNNSNVKGFTLRVSHSTVNYPFKKKILLINNLYNLVTTGKYKFRSIIKWIVSIEFYFDTIRVLI